MSTGVSGVSGGGGNTNSTPSKPSQAKNSKNRLSQPRNRARAWTFTNDAKASDLTEEEFWNPVELKKALDSTAEKYCFQVERGEESGKLHWQGWIRFKNQTSFSTLKMLMPKAHWEVQRGTDEQAIEYCRKVETREAGPWTKGIPAPVKDPLEDKALYEWQKEVLKIIGGEPGDREIFWFWEDKGGVGKTALAKHIVLKGQALYVSGKAADVKCAISSYLAAGNELRTVIWDIPRSQEGYVSYGGIEEVKNGIFFSGKYESAQQIFNSPHVIIFSNFYPDVTKLSQDRWQIRDIRDFM